MIYPQANNASAGGSAGKRAGKNSSFVEKRGVACRKNGKGGKPQQVVQWKQKNVEEGIVVVDEQQLSKLIKREPIEKHYALDPEPFATGLFATVRRCVSLDTGEVFAAKFSSRARYGEDCSAEIHHEIALLSLCAPSPRIVKLHDVFETPTEIIILMQFAPGGDLQTVIEDNLVPFETDVVNFVRQLVEGMAYLHERKIAHLDIKPQNLVMMGDFPNCDVKLCDFEISRVILEGTEIREILGTPDYVAPEILHYEPITLAADLWSLGVTTYVLLTGFSPFGGETDQETFCNISRAQLDFPEELFEDVSQDAKDFIRQLLVRDPSARPTAKSLLKHRWLSRQSTPNCRTAAHTGGEKNLRKYLSKSREALFERVVQQQQQRNNDLRKTTLLSQYNKTRMCESHASLVSRVREDRPLVGMSPSFSRSREKLYGLRSLSRSHEGLDLVKLGGGGGGGGGRRAYARAVTAELGNMTTPTPEDTPQNADKTFRKINSDSCIAVTSLVSPTLLRNTLEQCAKLMAAEQEDKQLTNARTDDVDADPTKEREQKQNGIAQNEDESKLTITTTAVDTDPTREQDKSISKSTINSVADRDKTQNGTANNEYKSKLSSTPTIVDANPTKERDKKQNSIANNHDKSRLTNTVTAAVDFNPKKEHGKTQNGITQNKDKSISTPTALDANPAWDRNKKQHDIAQNKDKYFSSPTTLDAYSVWDRNKKENDIAQNKDKSISTSTANSVADRDKTQNGTNEYKSKPSSTSTSFDTNSTKERDETQKGFANNEYRSKLAITPTALHVNTTTEHKTQNKDKSISTPTALYTNSTANRDKITQNGIVSNEYESKTSSTASTLHVNATTEHDKTQNGLNEDKTPKHDTTSANHVQLSRTENDSRTREVSEENSRITNVAADEAKERLKKVLDYLKGEGEVSEVRPNSSDVTATPVIDTVGPNISDLADNPNTSTAGPNSSDTPEEEPSFTVAQLISAYNRHQEVVTKTSLEVTMTTKMAPALVVAREPIAKFPTGPTALRLFIPDIDIETTVKKRKNRTKSYRTLARSEAVSVAGDRTKGEDDVPVASPATTGPDRSGASDFPPAATEVGPDYLRSVSLSSETSGGLTPSETLSSLSWEELAPTSTPTPTTPNPWGRLCNGSYTRAIDKFGGKSEPQTNTETNKTVNNTAARKCSLSMLFPQDKPDDEKVRRKSTSVIVKLS